MCAAGRANCLSGRRGACATCASRYIGGPDSVHRVCPSAVDAGAVRCSEVSLGTRGAPSTFSCLLRRGLWPQNASLRQSARTSEGSLKLRGHTAQADAILGSQPSGRERSVVLTTTHTKKIRRRGRFDLNKKLGLHFARLAAQAGQEPSPTRDIRGKRGRWCGQFGFGHRNGATRPLRPSAQ